MKSTRLVLLGALGLSLGLAACKPNEVQPPVAGASSGPGSPAIQQLSREQPHSSSVSAGTPAITGTSGGGEQAGRPAVTYSGQGAGTLSPGTPSISGTAGGGQRPGAPAVTYR